MLQTGLKNTPPHVYTSSCTYQCLMMQSVEFTRCVRMGPSTTWYDDQATSPHFSSGQQPSSYLTSTRWLLPNSTISDGLSSKCSVFFSALVLGGASEIAITVAVPGPVVVHFCLTAWNALHSPRKTRDGVDDTGTTLRPLGQRPKAPRVKIDTSTEAIMSAVRRLVRTLAAGCAIFYPRRFLTWRQ